MIQIHNVYRKLRTFKVLSKFNSLFKLQCVRNLRQDFKQEN